MSDVLHILVWVDKNRITELNFFICNINFPDKYPLTKTLRMGAVITKVVTDCFGSLSVKNNK